MKKKPEKTHEEKAAESYFEVDESDLKYATQKEIKENLPKENILKNTTQKEVKEISQNIIENIEKGAVKKNHKKIPKSGIEKVEEFTVLKKKFKKSKRAQEYSHPKFELKERGYELIITEKPQAALKIASALGNAVQKNINKVPYYEVERDGKNILVACAVGHLFTLKQKNGGYQIPVFDISWVPNYLAKKGDFTKRYYDTILKLAKNAQSLTVATDYDIEGEVIGLNIIRYICSQPDAYRMKFSTLTKPELEKSYENKSKHLDWGQAIAGETRHYLDWFYGINLSRALMNAIKTTGKFKIMSIGRVQGPALNLIVKRDREIQAFKSKPYWQVFIIIGNKKNKLELKYSKDIFNKSGLKNFENLKGKKAIAETIKKQESLPPPVPFNLTILQTEAYKFYGLNPSKTLQIAQSLYLAGLISYPRTSSQKLPDSIDYKTILKNLAREFKVERLITRNKPIEGGKTDSAHPSIYPTGNKQILSGDEDKIYKLIVKRFLSLFCDDALINNKTVKVNLEGSVFSKSGQSICKKSWMEIYPSKLKEEQIPDMEGEVDIIDSRTEQKETQPPKRYSPASIISELEKRNLGTKCLTGDTKILFNGEPIAVETIFNTGKFLSKEKDTEIREIKGKTISLENNNISITTPNLISKRKINDNEKIVEIETDTSKINLTADHLVYVFKDNKIEQIQAKDISINDKVVGILKNYQEGKVIINKNFFDSKFKIKNNEVLNKFSSKSSKGIRISSLPIKWSTSLAWILGYYYGDGSYSNPKYNGSHQIYFTTTENKALNLLKENIKQVFGVDPYCYNLSRKYKVNCNCCIAYALIKAFPELEGKNPCKIPKEFIGDFLRGFFDADGNVHLRPLGKTRIKGVICNSFDTPRVKITLSNEKLIKWVSNLLKELAIENKINKGSALCKGKRFDCWTILISGRDKIEKFAYKVGFDSYKEDILYKGLKCNSKNYKILQNCAKIILLLHKGTMKIEELIDKINIRRYEVLYALKKLYKEGMIKKKRFSQANRYLYSLNNQNIKYSIYCMKLIYNRVEKDIYEIPVRKLEEVSYDGYVYDLSVDEKSPNFITEGNILVHNSTRSAILETLYGRGYVEGQSIQATPLGISLIGTLEKYSPIIIDEKLTREFEEEMEKIQDLNEKSKQDKKEKEIIEKAKITITSISKDFEKNQEKIGQELLDANTEYREKQKIENRLIPCPKCGKGHLAISYSKKNRRYFVACDAYPECKNTFSLPPNGIIKKTDKICEHCQWPMLIRLSKGKKPWTFCWNSQCPTNKKRIEEYRKESEG